MIRNALKYCSFFVLSAFLLAPCLLHAQEAKEGGTSGGGGDRVEPLFFRAQREAKALMVRLHDANLDQLKLSPRTHAWLKSGGSSRIEQLQHYVGAMTLSF